MYSQNGEERIILQHFARRTGRFLDIGAADGITRSNTLRLLEQGWTGVCVEASPVAFSALLSRHESNPDVLLINALVSPNSGWTTFYEARGDGVSTACATHRDRWTSEVSFREMTAWAVTPKELLGLSGRRFDFVSLDIEGLNIPVLWGLLDSGLDCELMCIEHDGEIQTTDAMLSAYKRIDQNKENAIYTRRNE